MSKDDHFKLVNPLALAAAAAWIGSAKELRADGCGQYSDAPVCTNGVPTSEGGDVACNGEVYRGCAQGACDCADGLGNYDDQCCAGWGPGGGDNIDHAYCTERDAGYGGLGCMWPGADSNPTPWSSGGTGGGC
jgi:hypothetical protein